MPPLPESESDLLDGNGSLVSELEESTSGSSVMEEGQVHRQSVSTCDTLLIMFQVEVGSEMYTTPSSLQEEALEQVTPVQCPVLRRQLTQGSRVPG